MAYTLPAAINLLGRAPISSDEVQTARCIVHIDGKDYDISGVEVKWDGVLGSYVAITVETLFSQKLTEK